MIRINDLKSNKKIYYSLVLCMYAVCQLLFFI